MSAILPLPPVVGIYADSGRSGKGTVGDALILGYGYKRVQFSAPIKAMFTALCVYQGMDRGRIKDALEGSLKEAPLGEFSGMSFRQFGEHVGHTFGRQQVDWNVWANLWKPHAKQWIDAGHPVVVDDMRYLNEMTTVRSMGGVCIKIDRPSDKGGRDVQYPSEGWCSDELFDAVLENHGTVDELKERTYRAMSEIMSWYDLSTP